MPSTKKYTAQDLGAFLDGSFIGDPTEARSFCEQNMNPKLVRFAAEGDRTDFEQAVEKVELFRANCFRLSWWRGIVVLYQIVMMFGFGIIGRKGTNFKEPPPVYVHCILAAESILQLNLVYSLRSKCLPTGQLPTLRRGPQKLYQ
ncbi:hypothetical protein N7516_004216 [Penicillium verrucosum]|uniref:uncharacterized protein n=1 Tax=Penicillium verrucosum TaxID=60171 RepID=UPI0025451B54|nr:uncharacterized protein N7516_004216 [Penicillium verrucosum]KAJ5944048.1 hypothetical protein N7516_004216 [Penicillium verrucosum]